MPDGLRIPYTSARTRHGEALLRPQIPLELTLGGRSLRAVGLLDSGADVSVLPYQLGTKLGVEWSAQAPAVRLSGNLAQTEARGILVDVTIGQLGPVRLAFAWTRTDDVPLILGQVNFFAEFDVCFYRSRGFIELRPKGLGA